MNQKLPRRRFLKWALSGTAVVGLGWLRFRNPENVFEKASLVNLKASSSLVLMAVISTICPASWKLSLEEKKTLVHRIDDYLTGMASLDILQVNLLLLSLEQTPLLWGKGWSRFSRQNTMDQSAVLSDWKESRFGLRRLAYQTLKTMVFLALYREKKYFQHIGYSGPLVPKGFQGTSESQKRYQPLLASLGKEPQNP